MFHSCCMIAVAENTFECQTCHDVGAPLEGDSSDGDDLSSEDDECKCHDQFDNVYVGMPYLHGSVLEIYPSIDKVTVRIARGEVGCEIQRLKLSKVTQKVKVGRHLLKDANLSSME